MKTTNNEKKIIIDTPEKVDQVQTWSDYFYPYFTSEYYYAGQVVTTVAVVATAAVVYVYVAPAVASYWYGSSNNNPTNSPTTTNTSTDAPAINNTTDSLNIRTEEVQSVLPTEMQNTLPTINTITKKTANNINMDINNEIRYKYLYEACAHSKKKIENLVQNNQLNEYIKNINNKLYQGETSTFFLEYNKTKIKNKELITPEVIKDVAIIESKKKDTINKDIVDNIKEELSSIDADNNLTDGLDMVFLFLLDFM